jgi:hypothetical protein
MSSVGTNARAMLNEIEQRLHPHRARSWALARLDELFRGGRVADPPPDGFLEGRFITTSIWPAVDRVSLAMSRLWMPWLGESFDRQTSTGVNVLAPAARIPMRMWWPAYAPSRILADRIEAFPFRSYVERGAIDPDIAVHKIDYDLDSNPSFIIRGILDELVQVDQGLFLGKVLYRRQGSFHLLAFFSLQG